MNRRGFFKAVAATAVVAFAAQTRFAQTALRAIEPDWEKIGRLYSEALARSLIETKETIAANILNNAFTPNSFDRLLEAPSDYTQVSYGSASLVTVDGELRGV
jgi:hypothetical protein